MEENIDYVYIVLEHKHLYRMENGKNTLRTSTNLLAVGNNSHWAENFAARYVEILNLKKVEQVSPRLYTAQGYDNTDIDIKVIGAPMGECGNINMVAEEISFFQQRGDGR